MEADVSKVKGILLDLDGVLWRGDQLLPRARETVARLKDQGFQIRYVSNNSRIGFEGMKDRFKDLEIPAEPSEFILATQVLARALARKTNRATVYLIGSEGFRKDLEAQGLRVLDYPEEIDYLTDFVVVGSDWEFTFDKMTRALRCLMKGAKVAAPNADIYYPTEEGTLPGTGALLASINAMAKRSPDMMVGKPEPDLLVAAAKSMGLQAEECVMVGDTLDTDIKAAAAADMPSVLVLSGNSSRDDLKSAKVTPWKVIEGLSDLPGLF